MATLTSQLLVRLVDGVSGPAKAAAAALRALNGAALGGGGASLIAMQNRVGKAMERNSAAIAAMQGKLYGAATAGYALHRSLTPTIRTAMDFETVLEDIGQKSNLAGDGLKSVGQRIRQIGRQTNQGALKVGRGVDFLIGMGLGGKNDQENVDAAVGMAPAIGKTATAYRADFEELAAAAHSVFLNLKVPAEQMQFAFDVMAKSGKEGGFELANMAREFPALTAAAQFLGMKGSEAVADISAALQVARKGARDGEQAANNLANFFQKFTLKETVKNLKKFGVDVFKELDYARKKGISPIEHMMNVLRKITKNNPDLIPQIFGDKQVLEFIRPMWANMDEYRRIRAESLKAQGMVEEDFARRMETARAKTDRFLTSMESLAITLGNALMPGFTALIDKLGALAGMFDRFSAEHPKIAAGLAGIAAAMIALRVAALITGISGRVAYGGLLLMASGGLRALRVLRALTLLPLAAMARSITGFFQTLALRAGLATAATGRAPGVFARLADAFLVLSRGTMRLLNPMNILRSLSGLLMRMGPWGWAAAAGLAAVAFAASNWEGLQNFGAGFMESFRKNLAPLHESLQPLADAAGRLWDKLTGLFQLNASTEQWRSWGETLGAVAAGGVNKLIGAINSIAGALDAVAGKAQAAWSAIKGVFTAGSGGAAGAAAGAAGPAPAARARGGQVSRGQSYIVGERRPELFTPGVSGRITPRVPEGGSGHTINVAPVITVHGGGDADDIAAKVEARVVDAIQRTFRGIQGDARLGFAY